MNAITRLSDSMIKHQEAALKNQEEKSDSRVKAWRRLPKITQNIILLAGIDDNGEVPTTPTEDMYSILGCQNGAQVNQYLKQAMPGHNVSFEPGLCTALNKGMFICPDGVGSPSNFTPFLMPPTTDDEDDEQNAHLLKLAVQEKYDSTDIELLTKMEVSIPMKSQELRHYLKNIAEVAGRCMGSDSVFYAKLMSLYNHIERHDMSYNFEFRNDKLFGGNFLDRIHYRIQRFLESCASGDPAQIKVKHLEFDEMLESIERREYYSKNPIWLTKLMKKRAEGPKKQGEENPRRGGGGGSYGAQNGDNNKRCRFQPQDQSKKISNSSICQACQLTPNEPFRDLFHPGNIRQLKKPERNGVMLCMRFHILGYCFSDCKYKSGNGVLGEAEQAMKTFVAQARTNLKQFRRTGNRTSQDQPGRPSMNAAPAGEIPEIE